ncbi:class I SAM-dependent methyltransferase [Paractinoplanes lichenicola]|uniref:Methyltransferase domain-containing protein n=1 Tax=Paractinoplanes lichenicola TaxID=2802976 RepID=A0ABS1W042_9ACTN|nr:methyltransferase domain-containing protein [Actinoplanes lichenicola]MBL7260115.1 methyltransferase domain-containing protein [Actinoplanes lichenicola]
MSVDEAALTAEQRARWTTVLDHLIAALPGESCLVLVDGADDRAALFADGLAARLRGRGRRVARTVGSGPAGAVTVVDGRGWRERLPDDAWHMTVWVRGPSGEYRGEGCDVVVDLHDPGWPVLREMNAALLPAEGWYRTESRAFFAIRAATWDVKFGADLPAYADAVAEAALAPGGVAVDVGCGTGRALPALRAATGPSATIIGIDHTPQMLAAACERARDSAARLLLADARHLPLADRSVHAVFAAGLINHLPDPAGGLAELARITRPGGRLVLFHPSGRAALAARHGRRLRPDEPLAEHLLGDSMDRTGWQLTTYDDPEHRFLAVAVRLDLDPGVRV